MGWFGAVFAGFIAAQKAFIEELESQIIKLKTGGVIYGGDKYLPSGELNTKADKDAKGFWLGANGQAKLEGAEVSGELKAATGTFTGKVTANEGELNNVVINESCTVKGALAAQSIIVSGSHTAGERKTYVQGGYTHIDDPASRVANPGIVAYDNRRVGESTINLGAQGTAVKRLRVAGKGSIRFRVYYRGWVTIREMTDEGGLSIVANLAAKDPDGYEWSDPVPLNKEINIFYLFGGIPDGSTASFTNTVFEARSANEPGLFKLLSSPF
jgi:hypothetical protein